MNKGIYGENDTQFIQLRGCVYEIQQRNFENRNDGVNKEICGENVTQSLCTIKVMCLSDIIEEF